jgi:hypothetical protein
MLIHNSASMIAKPSPATFSNQLRRSFSHLSLLMGINPPQTRPYPQIMTRWQVCQPAPPHKCTDPPRPAPLQRVRDGPAASRTSRRGRSSWWPHSARVTTRPHRSPSTTSPASQCLSTTALCARTSCTRSSPRRRPGPRHLAASPRPVTAAPRRRLPRRRFCQPLSSVGAGVISGGRRAPDA